MRFWPFKKKPVELGSPDGPPPAYLQAALDEARKRPLDDMVWRLVGVECCGKRPVGDSRNHERIDDLRASSPAMG